MVRPKSRIKSLVPKPEPLQHAAEPMFEELGLHSSDVFLQVFGTRLLHAQITARASECGCEITAEEQWRKDDFLREVSGQLLYRSIEEWQEI
jgi:hypothetical protein